MLEALVSLGTMAAMAFLSATILPFPSEAVFAGLLARGEVQALALFVTATVFNTLGSVSNWWIGRLAASGHLARLPERLRPGPETLAKAEALFARFGWLALLLSWVPGIGDLGTLAAGLLRYRLLPFILLVGIGKASRYAAIWAGWIAITG